MQIRELLTDVFYLAKFSTIAYFGGKNKVMEHLLVEGVRLIV